LQRKYTKAGDLMGVFTLEDLESTIEVMVFPKTMLECNHVLAEDALIAVKGRLDTRDDIPKLIAMTVARLEVSLDGGGPPLRLQLPANMDEGRVAELKTVLLGYPGDSDVFVHFGRQVMRLPTAFRVNYGKELTAELLVLFGSEAIIG
jgi:DNA polymerase III subunit alpha